jgi:hypothetical protein
MLFARLFPRRESRSLGRTCRPVAERRRLSRPPILESLEERALLSNCAVPDDASWQSTEGGCKDLQTGLVWTSDNTGSWSFVPGLDAALNSVESGFSDWRLPSIQEAQAAIAHGAATHVDSYLASYPHWSTSLTGRVNSSNVLTAWGFDFRDGSTIENPIWSASPLALVRGGSSTFFVDDGGPGYTDTVSGWTVVNGQGKEGDYRYHVKGDGSATATFTFTGLTAGTYKVQATWVALQSNATDAPFRIFDDATFLQQIRVNQRKAPSSNVGYWATLGDVTISSSTLKVVLSNNAKGNVQADMVRLVPVSPTALASMASSRDRAAASVDLVLEQDYSDNRDDRDESATRRI